VCRNGRCGTSKPVEGAIVEAVGLRKRYDKHEVVCGVDFTVRPRECFGLLGPNGAGKTTTIRMLTGFAPYDGGSLAVFGLPMNAANAPTIKSRLGVAPQEENLDPDLTVAMNLRIYASYFGIGASDARARVAELLAFAELEDKADARIPTLSGGMKRRLILARALINRPSLLVLDEPTTGLDPQARHVVWDRLYRLKRQGVTLLLTTHYMDEAEQLCDRLVVMDRGRIVAEGSPRSLIERYSTREVVELRFEDGSRPDDLSYWTDGVVDRVEALPDRVLLYTQDGDAASHQLHERGLMPESLLVRRSTLEDVFLHLTGRSLIE
jgi:lipooligosaccharide transport system ATP-binding protein